MVSSFGISVMFLILTRNGVAIGTAQQLLIGIVITTGLLARHGLSGSANRSQVLVDFYHESPSVRARAGAGSSVKAGVSNADAGGGLRTENFPVALLGWFTGCIMIWSALFTVGNFLYGRMNYAFGLLAVFLVTAAILIQVVRRFVEVS